MSYIHPTAIIYPNVKIGKDVYIGAYCVIGAPAESKAYWNEIGKGVIIFDGAIINGHCTIDAGTEIPTRIGTKTFIMKGVHVGHDAYIEDGATLSPHVVIGGHSIVGKNTNMGIASVVHQRVTIPSGCMIGMNSTITKKTVMEENNCYIGNPARWLRQNIR